MKALRLLFGLFIVLSFSFGAREAAALSSGYEPVTCSGDMVFHGTQNFFFGMKDKDSCGVQAIYANSLNEAWGCAERLCPACTLEDITALFQMITPYTGDPKEQYCKKK